MIAFIGFTGTISTFLGTAFMAGAIPYMFWTGLRKNKLKWLVLISAAWMLGAFLNVLYTQTVIESQVQSGMISTHSYGFPDGGILLYPAWLWSAFSMSFDYFLNIALPVPVFMKILTPVVIILSVPGLIWLFRIDRQRAVLLLLPILMIIALATLHLLPLIQRFSTAVIWILPLLTMLLFTYLREKVSFLKPWMTNVLIVLLILPNTLALIAGIFTLPADFDPTEKLLAAVKADLEPGQMILVHPRAYLQMEYYAPKAGIDDFYILENETTPEMVKAKLEELNPEEAWLIVTNVLEYPSAVTVEEYDDIFGERAEIKKEHRLTQDTYAILYKFE